MGVTMCGEAERIGLLLGGSSMLAHCLGAGLLLMLAAYLVFGLRHRQVEWRGRRLATPASILTPLQIVVAATDLPLAGLALSLQLPPIPVAAPAFARL